MQCLTRFLVGQLVRRQPPQLLIDQRQEALSRSGIALFNLRQDAGDVAHHITTLRENTFATIIAQQ